MISVTRVLQWSEIFQDQSSVRVAALGIISVVICACIDDCSRWALHEPRSWISFAVTSLAYCLVFLRKVNLTVFCVFWCNYVVLAFVVPYVYFNVNVEDAISQEGGVCYGFKFDRNIRDGSGFILLALAPPEVLFASVCALFESALPAMLPRTGCSGTSDQGLWSSEYLDWAIFHVWFIRIRYR